MIIDIHSHIFPSAIAAKTVDKLATAACVNPNTDGTAEGLSASMRRAGVDYSVTLPTSAFMGATFLLAVDDLARIATTAEIPLGILTSFVGAPVFLYLIAKGGRRNEA